ncbi:GGDEF domain-containing protein [Neptuniibacter sp.]|uniref:GGDEF domain-containing protein n=1 Tax=Neptuniibacter sp. TaxID=1962643 RepID=UPI003B5BE503
MSPTILSMSSSVFLKRFCWVAVSAVVLVLVLSSFVTFKLYERYVVGLAESNAVNIATSIVSVHQEKLSEALNPSLSPVQLEELDMLIKAFMGPYGIVKVKLFSLDGTVVYSNDMSIIGENSLGNKHLESALKGGQSSTIQTKNQIRDLTHEDRFDVDVVESYVAMKKPEGKVIGAFEIYQDMTFFRQEVSKGVFYFLIELAVILITVVAAAFWFVRKAAVTMVMQQKELGRLATIDTVTNLYNRAEITRRMASEWERYQRNPCAENSFGVMMLDLDHFKRINDNYGHQVGDELLRQVSAKLLSEVRAYSEVGRYGGEEFIILLPGTGLSELASISDRLLKLVAEQSYKVLGEDISLTVSIGIAASNKFDSNLDAVIKRADDNLYKAKAAGRNCVAGAA